MSRVIEVRTPGRLHFGLSSFGGSGRQFGGVGLMVAGTGVTLRASEADKFSITGLHSQRVYEFAHTFSNQQQLTQLSACQLEVTSAPPDHVGLGIGTQLGLAVVVALSQWQGTCWRDAELLSQCSGRGNRSAIGTHGFLHGGLIVDHGKLPAEPLGELAQRVDVPAEWRFVLIRPPSTQGLSGQAEAKAMLTLPPVPAKVTETLHTIIANRLLPAVQSNNFAEFSTALYDYGYRAGECFAPAQGGPFASDDIAQLVEQVRELGYPGVGQSSWGPTVFVMAHDQRDAEQLVAQLREHHDYSDHHFDITQANNTGVIVEDVSLGHLEQQV